MQRKEILQNNKKKSEIIFVNLDVGRIGEWIIYLTRVQFGRANWISDSIYFWLYLYD